MTTSENTGPAVSAGPVSCFHCGLPVPRGLDLPPLVVFDEPRRFCCMGCRAVCETIVASGLDDYYQYRERSDSEPRPAVVPDILKQLEIYDRPEVQQGFVEVSSDAREASLILENIRCSACLWLNEKHLRQQPGILAVAADATTQRMRVRWDPEQTRLSAILRAISEIGYIAHPYDASLNEELQKQGRRRSIERLIVAGLFGMLVMNFSAATYVLGGPDPSGALPLWESVGRWSSLFACLVLLVYPAQDFWFGAWRDLKLGRVGMDTPIVIGLSIAFFGSLYNTVTLHADIYLDSIAMFVFFVLLARYFETRGKVRAVAHLDHLARVVPQMVYRRGEPADAWQKVPIIDLEAGDVVRVLPGEAVPVDGAIVDGVSSFNESLLTGEALPVTRGPGDSVLAGSVNGEQPVTLRITCTGTDTMLATIRRLVEKGLEKKSRVELLADRIARGFVAVILAIAATTGITWYLVDPAGWLPSTIAVLIVTCPCALALATPVAMAVGAGRLVESGILPARMNALEAMARVDTVAFDKTGTLTTGEPELHSIQTFGQVTDNDALTIAGRLSLSSEHPLARALVRNIPSVITMASEIRNVPGEGLCGVVDGEQYWLGSPAFIAGQLQQDGNEPSPPVAGSATNALTLLANRDGLMAIFLFVDPVRDDAQTMVDGLKDLGIRNQVILSGDIATNVSRVASVLDIPESLGAMRPTDKLGWLQARQAEGRRVMMLGDGLNDAPTIAAADVSVSPAGGADLTNISSDFILLGGRLSALPTAVKLARRTVANVRQNILWAVSYNLVAVPFAALGYIPPWVAALGMSASSLVVVINALRLKLS